MKNNFVTKSGLLTNFALSCGYIERYTTEDTSVTLSWNTPVYHVKSFDRRGVISEGIWNSYTSLKDARKCFFGMLKQLNSVSKQEYINKVNLEGRYEHKIQKTNYIFKQY